MQRPRCRLSRALAATIGVALLAAAASPALAQWTRPDEASRLVRAWDFDQRYINGYEVAFPVGWISGNPLKTEQRREGFPHWNRPGFTDRDSFSGDRAAELPTRGGSTSILLAPGVLPALPEADYLISARFKADALEHTRARITARFLRVIPAVPGVTEPRYEPIPGAEAISTLLRPDPEWRAHRLVLRGHPDAEFIQLEIALLQPEQYRQEAAGAHAVIHEDVRGALLVDDVQIFQMPRLTLELEHEGNVVVEPQLPTFTVRVEDRTGEALSATLRAWDLDGNVVDSTTIDLGAFAARESWTPDLPRFGWYRVALTVRNSVGVVGQAYDDLVYAPPRFRGAPDDAFRFVLVSETLDPAAMDALPGLLDRLAAEAVQVSAWGAVTDADAPDARERFDAMVEQLLERDVDVSFVLGAVPEDVAREQRVDQHDPLALLGPEEERWLPDLEPVLATFGERVLRWQIGATGEDRAFWRADLPERIGAIRDAVRRLVPRPIIAVPWEVVQSPPQGPGPDSLTVTLPQDVPAASIPLYAETWTDGRDVTLVIEPPDDAMFGRTAAAIETARRVILAWEAGTPRIALRAPWTWQPPRAGGTRGEWRPSVSAAVWRTLTEQLAGRRPAGELPVADGVRVLIAKGDDSSVLLAWNEAAASEDAVLRAYLGSTPITVRDMFGNTRAVTPTGGLHEIPLSPMPLIVENVDLALARFRANVRIEPGTIPARAQRHELELVMENPWPVGVSGRIRLAEPDSWEFRPRVLPFSIGPGETLRLPTTAVLGVGEESGDRTVVAELALSASERYPPMKVLLPVDVKLEGVELGSSYRFTRGPNGDLADLVLTASVTNTSDRPISLEAFAQAPGYATEIAPISALRPGDTNVRTFTFAGAAQSLRGKRVRVGVREQQGNGRLNKTMRVE